MRFAADTCHDLLRWLISGSLVLMAHGGLAAGFAYWHGVEEDDDPTAALVVDLAPMPVSPADMQLPIPPGPEQVQAEASPQRPVEKADEKPEEVKELKEVREEQPVLPPEQGAELASAHPEVQKEVPKLVENQLPAPATTAPQAPKVQEAPIAAAPNQGRQHISNSNAVPTWKRQVVALIERNKRAPAAQARGAHGIVQLSFSLDRQGHVIASRIAKSSGSAALDEAAVELLRRAGTFPPPPPEMPGAQIDLTIPIRYRIQ